MAGCWMVVGLSPSHPLDGYEPRIISRIQVARDPLRSLPNGTTSVYADPMGVAFIPEHRIEGGTMARGKSFTSYMYKAARLSATGRSIRTGKAPRRAKNIVVGWTLGKAGVWRRLWR